MAVIRLGNYNLLVRGLQATYTENSRSCITCVYKSCTNDVEKERQRIMVSFKLEKKERLRCVGNMEHLKLDDSLER